MNLFQAIALCKLAIDRFPGSRTASAAYRRWSEVLALPDLQSGHSMDTLNAEHEAYRSRLAQ